MRLPGNGVDSRRLARIRSARLEEATEPAYKPLPRWLDRLLCALGWVLLVLALACGTKGVGELVTSIGIDRGDYDVTAPDYPREY